jgi:hypothetical protein
MNERLALPAAPIAAGCRLFCPLGIPMISKKTQQ